MPYPNICLTIPSEDGWIHGRLLRCILSWISKYPIKIYIISNIRPVQAARNQCINAFLESKIDYLMMVDSDTIPPFDAIDRLLILNTDIAAISTNTTKDGFLISNIYRKDKDGYRPIKSKKVIDADAVGFGCVMIKRDVINKLEMPYFYIEKNRFCEDIIFCERAKEKGFKIKADMTVQCNHSKELIL